MGLHHSTTRLRKVEKVQKRSWKNVILTFPLIDNIHGRVLSIRGKYNLVTGFGLIVAKLKSYIHKWYWASRPFSLTASIVPVLLGSSTLSKISRLLKQVY